MKTVTLHFSITFDSCPTDESAIEDAADALRDALNHGSLCWEVEDEETEEDKDG